MRMNRRNVLIGLSTAAAGSGAIFGSGAFTQVQADRDVSIDVNNDANASVGIKAGAAGDSAFTDISPTGDDNSLNINLSSNNDEINAGATYTIGNVNNSTFTDSPDTDEAVAFLIEDQSDFTTDNGGTGDTGLAVQIEDLSGTNNDLTSLQIQFFGDGDDDLSGTASESGSATTFDFSSAPTTNPSIELTNDTETIGFILNSAGSTFSDTAAAVITVDTSDGGATSDNFSATPTLQITAESIQVDTT